MNERIMQVEGRAELKITPDQVSVICRLSVFATDYRAAQTGLNERVALLRDAAPGQGLTGTDFKTTGFCVDRVTEETEHRRKIAGYRARHTLRLELPLQMDRLNRIVAACAGSGAAPEIDVEFGVKDHEAVREQLLAVAVANARRRGEILAQAAGVKLGEIQRIDYGVMDVRVSSYSYDMSLAEAGPDLTPGDLDAADKVTVVWQIL